MTAPADVIRARLLVVLLEQRGGPVPELEHIATKLLAAHAAGTASRDRRAAPPSRRCGGPARDFLRSDRAAALVFHRLEEES